MGLLVTKANGNKQPFDKSKIVDTCLRMGASHQIAQEIAEKVEQRLYEGITTKQILQLIFSFFRRYNPVVKNILDLRRALSLMDPKPEFEMFIQMILANSGFEVGPNRILKGKCGEHEVDAIAKKDGLTYFVEVKHHYGYHALTGLDESRIAQAIIEDVNDAYALGIAPLKIDRAMIVSNTRYSEHAIQYGSCKNILQIGWDSPPNLNLKDMIHKCKLYPISSLKGIQNDTKNKLVRAGIIATKQVLALDGPELARKTGLPKKIAWDIVDKVKTTADALW